MEFHKLGWRILRSEHFGNQNGSVLVGMMLLTNHKNSHFWGLLGVGIELKEQNDYCELPGFCRNLPYSWPVEWSQHHTPYSPSLADVGTKLSWKNVLFLKSFDLQATRDLQINLMRWVNINQNSYQIYNSNWHAKKCGFWRESNETFSEFFQRERWYFARITWSDSSNARFSWKAYHGRDFVALTVWRSPLWGCTKCNYLNIVPSWNLAINKDEAGFILVVMLTPD